MIKINQATTTGYIELEDNGVADLSYPGSKYRRGRVQNGGGISPTVTCSGELHRFERRDEAVNNYMDINGKRYRIRKLTENECAKLMGLPDVDEKLKNIGVSKTQRYKMYGNGIVTNCIKLIFEHLFKAQYDENYVCSDENFTQATMA